MTSDPLIGQTINNYEILYRLGKGGMASVYRARQSNMARDVAIKIMSADLAEDPKFVARFEQEARVIANLQHPRILPVHDFGHVGDLFYLVMRVIDGESLYHRMIQGPLPIMTAAKFVNQIAEALDYAHSQGIIHRDLKPNNVLIDEWDNCYLMDFGLAKLLASTQNLTQSGAVLGTPAYMAPEQWRGENVDARTDVYALGVILYEMVLGHPPFESDTPFTLMYKHINDPPPRPSTIMPDMPDEIEEVILKALAKERVDRYQSAGDLARAFMSVARVAGSLTVRERLEDAQADEQPAEEKAAAESAAIRAEPVDAAAMADVAESQESQESHEVYESEGASTSPTEPDGPATSPDAPPAQSEEPEQSARSAQSGPISPVVAAVDVITGVPDTAPDSAGLPPVQADLVPPPVDIAPPPPPIPVAFGGARRQNRPAAESGVPVVGQYPSPTSPPRSRSGAPASPPSPPPSSRFQRALEAVDQSLEAAAEKAVAAIPVSGELQAGGPPSTAEPVNAPAFDDVRGLIPASDPLMGVLDVRGTAQWQTWKYMFIGGIAAFFLGGIIGAGFLSFLGLVLMGYLGVMGYRIYRGKTGAYYLGFTPQRVIVLPRDPSGWPQTHSAWVVPWEMVQRLRLTDRYVLLDIAAEGTTLSLGALVAPEGAGGLGQQVSWLPDSMIVHLITEQGFETRNL